MRWRPRTCDRGRPLAVAKGTYLVSYSNFFSDVGTSGIQCYVFQNNAPGVGVFSGWSALVYTSNPSWHPSLTGTGIATKSETSDIEVHCDAGDSTFSTTAPMVITATRTTLAASKTLIPEDGGPVFRQR